MKKTYLLWTCPSALVGLAVGSLLPFFLDYAVRLNDMEGIIFLGVSVPVGTMVGALIGSWTFGKKYDVSRAFHIRTVTLSLVGVVSAYGAWVASPVHLLLRFKPFVLPLVPFIQLVTTISVLLSVISIQFVFPEWSKITERSNQAL